MYLIVLSMQIAKLSDKNCAGTMIGLTLATTVVGYFLIADNLAKFLLYWISKLNSVTVLTDIILLLALFTTNILIWN